MRRPLVAAFTCVLALAACSKPSSSSKPPDRIEVGPPHSGMNLSPRAVDAPEVARQYLANRKGPPPTLPTPPPAAGSDSELSVEGTIKAPGVSADRYLLYLAADGCQAQGGKLTPISKTQLPFVPEQSYSMKVSLPAAVSAHLCAVAVKGDAVVAQGESKAVMKGHVAGMPPVHAELTLSAAPKGTRVPEGL